MLHRRIFTGAAAMMMAMACSMAPALAGSPTQMLPADSVMVIQVDMAGLVGTPLYQKYSAMFGPMMPTNDPEFQEFKAGTGFSPEADLKTVTVGLTGDLTGKPAVFAVAKGKFDTAKFEAFANEKGDMEFGEVQGVKTFTPKDDPEAPTMAFLDGNTLLLSSREHFVNHVERAHGKGKNVTSSAQLGGLLNQDGQVSISMVLPEMAKQQMAANPQAAALGNINTLAIAMKATDGLALNIVGNTDSADNGKMAHDALSGLLAMGRMMSAENPDMAAMLNNLKLEQDGQSVKIGLAMTGAELDKMMAAMGPMMMGGGQ